MVCIAGALALLAEARPARADDSTERAAEAAFADGLKLMKADHCREALERFRESQRLDPASGTLLNIAYCENNVGHVASAWLAYRQAIPLAEASHKPQHIQMAQDAANGLEPELPLLTLSVPEANQRALSISLDGQAFERSAWSVPVPVDPGRHDVVAVLEDGQRWERSVTLARAERMTIELPSRPATAAPPAAAQSAHSEPSKTPARAPHSEASRTWAYATGGVGLATLLTGSALFVSARLKYDSADSGCDGQNRCNDAAYTTRKSAIGRAELAYALGGAGAVLTGVGVTLWLTSETPSQNQGAQATILVGGDAESARLLLRGYW
ncbi:MAG TPA: hypothetical protein VGM29_12560 [Polyangiaceae bacterium]